MAYSYDRRAAVSQQPTEIAKKWVSQFKHALQTKGITADKLDLTYGGNVRSFLEATLGGTKIPTIVIEEEKVRQNYNRLKWVRVDQGPGAKFVTSAPKMADYIVQRYLS